MALNAGLTAFELAFVKSPIILCNGIAQAIPGGMLPIIAITEAANFNLGILNGSNPLRPDDYFANFFPLSGATLVDNDIGLYPFANQAVAANAIIAKPLQLSMGMDIPVKQAGGYAAKLVTMTALKAAFDTHNQSGGTYSIATPSFIYTNGIMVAFRDVSRTESAQAQNRWQMDFIFPLLTQQQATTALGSLLSKVSGGQPQASTLWSSVENSIGLPISQAGTSLPVGQSILGISSSSTAASSAGQLGGFIP